MSSSHGSANHRHTVTHLHHNQTLWHINYINIINKKINILLLYLMSIRGYFDFLSGKRLLFFCNYLLYFLVHFALGCWNFFRSFFLFHSFVLFLYLNFFFFLCIVTWFAEQMIIFEFAQFVRKFQIKNHNCCLSNRMSRFHWPPWKCLIFNSTPSFRSSSFWPMRIAFLSFN